ncbi:MAG: NAD(+) synthetase [Candidatus Pacebacteria bacterium CG_4_10_14_0_8_um_filter_42_14]|nr:MAG: NAD(+) synthetase [Candidatus Pacebacteria bacterium CG_4_10_14_0_8_um_filter_42_14]
MSELVKITDFLRQTFSKTGKTKAVIAVSGGIDSAVALTFLVRALGSENVYPIMLPFANQSSEDSKKIITWNGIPEGNTREINIENFVKSFQEKLQIDSPVRLGNIKARSRMIVVFDLAKELDALVCGTENKSEKHLGYFTRFGDAASDIEPLSTLYKTQVRELAQELGLPQEFIEKAPSAELWSGQTDEEEMGFSYEVADKVLVELIDNKRTVDEIIARGEFDKLLVERVAERVESQKFKQVVPYEF